MNHIAWSLFGVHFWKAVTLRFLHGVASVVWSQNQRLAKLAQWFYFEPTQINETATEYTWAASVTSGE